MENKPILQSKSYLGFLGIIRESLKTTGRNMKVLVTMLLLVIFSFSIIDFSDKYMFAPLEKYFLWQLANYPNMVHNFIYSIDENIYAGALSNLRFIIIAKLSIMASSSVIILTYLVTIVSFSSAAYTAKVLDPKLLRNWKRPLVTFFYIILLTLGIIFLYIISLTITIILAANSWALLFVGAIALSIPVCFFYMGSLWIVTMVVSVLEEGVGGVKAIGRATELMNGKRLQASLMMVPFVVACGVVHLISNYALTSTVIRIPLINAMFCMLTLFMFVVYTVFYHERKTILDEKEGKGYDLPIVSYIVVTPPIKCFSK